VRLENQLDGIKTPVAAGATESFLSRLPRRNMLNRSLGLPSMRKLKRLEFRGLDSTTSNFEKIG
jgi:hypothetical protein